MTPLLSKSVLDKIARTLYGDGLKAEFFSLSPLAGEQSVGVITGGFNIIREERSAGRDGSGVKMLLAHDAGITREVLDTAGAVVLTIDGITTRYAIDELLPQQQIRAGYVLRLIAQRGATA